MKNVKKHSQFDDTDTFALLIEVSSSEFELWNSLFKLQVNVLSFALVSAVEVKLNFCRHRS